MQYNITLVQGKEKILCTPSQISKHSFKLWNSICTFCDKNNDCVKGTNKDTLLLTVNPALFLPKVILPCAAHKGFINQYFEKNSDSLILHPLLLNIYENWHQLELLHSKLKKIPLAERNGYLFRNFMICKH